LKSSGLGSTPKLINQPSDNLPPVLPDDIDGKAFSGGSLGQAEPTKLNGYFMKKYASVQSVHDRDEIGGIAPETEILPDPQVDPGLEIMTHEFEKLEIFSVSDKIDSKFLPGPDREDSYAPVPSMDDKRNGNQRYRAWSHSHSVHCIPDAWSDNDRTKAENWGGHLGHPNTGWDSQCSEGQKDGGDKDTSSTDSGGTDDNEKLETTADEPVEDENGAKPDGTRDSDPEGGDPDEFKTPASVLNTRSAAVSATPAAAERLEAAGGDNRTGRAGGEESGGSGYQGSMPQGGGSPNDPSNNPSYRDPEGEGRPDEMVNPTSSGAVNSAVIAGHNYQPEPGGGDPDDPRASDGSMMSAGTTMGHAASPPDGGQGGETGPDDPRFIPSF
ncbi:hypothetical protein ACFL2O_08900, partial [Thermodesulfobacteriota bacterium]